MRRVLEEDDCLGGNKVGFECRWIITNRGEITVNQIKLKLKLKIQSSVLYRVVQAVDNYGWSSGLLFKNIPVHPLGNYGIKGYIEKDYLKGKLGELGNDENNIEMAQMFCFESMNLGIMKSDKKPYAVVQEFVRNNPELVKKIAIEHPEFFVDGSIVEACIRAMPV